jgi:uncharacterized protein YggT (Ycf19 family)
VLRPLRSVVPLVGGVDITPLFAILIFQLVFMPLVAWLELDSLRTLGRALL